MSTPAFMQQTLVSNEHITIVLRDIADSEAARTGQLLGGKTPPAGTWAGSPEAVFYWTARTEYCIASGLAIGLFEPGREAPFAVALALTDNMDTGRAVVDGYVLMEPDNYSDQCNAALLQTAKNWAASLGRELGAYVEKEVPVMTKVRVWQAL